MKSQYWCLLGGLSLLLASCGGQQSAEIEVYDDTDQSHLQDDFIHSEDSEESEDDEEEDFLKEKVQEIVDRPTVLNPAYREFPTG